MEVKAVLPEVSQAMVKVVMVATKVSTTSPACIFSNFNTTSKVEAMEAVLLRRVTAVSKVMVSKGEMAIQAATAAAIDRIFLVSIPPMTAQISSHILLALDIFSRTLILYHAFLAPATSSSSLHPPYSGLTSSLFLLILNF
jgi:hypothetical protein